MLLCSETNRPSADSTTILCQWWLTLSGLLQVVDTTEVDKSTVSLAVHNVDATLETIPVLTHGNCIMGHKLLINKKKYKWFLHHLLTVNQRLTNLPSNQALNNVLNSYD